MKNSRESIAAALFALVAAAPTLKTTSRRTRMWTDVAAEEQPALFMAQREENTHSLPITGIPNSWELLYTLYVYTSVGGDPAAVPATQLNNILDYLEQVLPSGVESGGARRMIPPQTLGGLVVEARIHGKVLMDEGNLGAQAVAIVPVRVSAF